MNKNTIKIVLLVLAAVIFSFGTVTAQKSQGKDKKDKVEKKKEHKGHDHDKAKGHNHDHKGHNHGNHKGHDHDKAKGHGHNDHKGHDHDKTKGHNHDEHKGHNHGNHKGHDHQAKDKVRKAEVTAENPETTITLYKNKIKAAKDRLEAEKKANPQANDLAEKEERIKIAEKKLAEMELELNKSRMIIELGKDGQIPD